MTPREELEALRRMAELEAKAASVRPPSGPSAALAAGRGGAQGFTLGTGDEATGLIQAASGGRPNPMANPLRALAELTSGVPAAQRLEAGQLDEERLSRQAETEGGQFMALVKRYREERDAERRSNAAAREAQPWAYIPAEIAASVPSSFLLPGGGSGGALKMGASGAAVGAGMGLASSEADLTKGDVLGALADMAKGGALGGALGAGLSYLPRLAGKGAQLLQALGITQGRKVLTGGTKSISQAAAVSDDAVKRALDEGAIQPLGTTAGAAERLAALREAAGAEYARIVAALEAAGVKGPQRDALARELMERAAGMAESNVGAAPGYLAGVGQKVAKLPARERIPGEFAAVPARAPGVVSERVGGATAAADEAGFRVGEMGELIATAPRPAAALPVRPSSPGPSGAASEVGELIERPVERLGLTQAENLKRSLQEAATQEYKRVGGNLALGDAKMEAASRARAAVERAVQEQAGLAPAETAAFQPVKKRVGELIEASSSAERALNSAQNKNAVSLRDLLLMGAGNSGAQKAALLPFSMAARAFGPSTVAAGASKGARLLEKLGRVKPGPKLTAAERALLQAYLDQPAEAAP